MNPVIVTQMQDVQAEVAAACLPPGGLAALTNSVQAIEAEFAPGGAIPGKNTLEYDTNTRITGHQRMTQCTGASVLLAKATLSIKLSRRSDINCISAWRARKDVRHLF